MHLDKVSQETWARVDQLLDHALDLPESDREAWLASLGPEHRRDLPLLRNLLSRRVTAGRVDMLPRLATPQAPVPVWTSDRRVGQYRLLRPLGEGGMGTVWLAERTDVMTRRLVALKLPRGSWMAEPLRQRLEREREILATLAHPNIARLLDAGVTPSGEPYLALEYVNGQPIDVHARAVGLGLRARIELFLQVLAAVAHAHARLVVHRDLKPSNVLVTEDGQVRLLDFGIAKLLEDGGQSELTEISGAAFTPDHASPEQLAGERIGVASDIYSLGILLYGLLADVAPYHLRRSSERSYLDQLRELRVPRPSEVAPSSAKRLLAGDLDVVVQKAMRLAPEERYPTATAFAEELTRFLTGHPVLARPDSLGYRTRKFVLRHRAASAAAAAILAAVTVGTSTALWQARRAATEQRRAEEVKELLTEIFQDASPYGSDGRSLSVVQLLQRAHADLERIGGQRPELRVELLNLLGSTLLELGETDAGERMASQALRESSVLPPGHPQHLRARLLGCDALLARGRGAELRAELERLIPELRARADRQPADLVRALEIRAHLGIIEVRREEAIADAREALDLARSRFGDRDPRTVSVAVLLGEAHQYGDRDPQHSLAEAERGLRFAQAAYPGQPKHPRVIYARDVYGRALCHAGHPDQSYAEMTRALEDAREALGAASPLVGMISINRVTCERRLGHLSAALEDNTRGLAIRGPAMARDSRAWGNMHLSRGATLLALRRGPEALADLTPAVESLTRALGPTHRMTLSARLNRALALAEVGRGAEAREEIGALEALQDAHHESLSLEWIAGRIARITGRPEEAAARQRRALERLPDDPARQWYLMRVLVEMGLAELGRGLPGRAEASLRDALALAGTELREEVPFQAEAWVGLGRALLLQGRNGESIEPLRKADAFWRRFDPRNPAGVEAAQVLGTALERMGRSGEARATLARVAQLRATSTEGIPPPR